MGIPYNENMKYKIILPIGIDQKQLHMFFKNIYLSITIQISRLNCKGLFSSKSCNANFCQQRESSRMKTARMATTSREVICEHVFAIPKRAQLCNAMSFRLKEISSWK